MDLFGDGFTFLDTQSAHWMLILAAASLGSLLLFGCLRCLLGEYLNTLETLALALAGWPFLWVFSATLGLALNLVMNFGPLLVVFIFVLCGLAIVSGWKRSISPPGVPFWTIALLLLVFLLSLLTRLLFLKELVVPSYFDGALHYNITQSLLDDFTRLPWQNAALPLHGYYHIGLHLLAAVFSAMLNVPQIDTLLGLGAILLAVIPFPVFFIILRATDSLPAAFFGFLLAGWGWSMPAHALDWGKYPAIAGLLTLQVALALTFLATRPALPLRTKISLAGLFLAATTISVILHSRALIVIALALVSYFAAKLWNDRANRMIRSSTLALLLLGLVILCAYLQSRDILKLVFDSYVKNVWWLTLAIALLTPLAFKRSGTLAFASLLTSFLLLLSLLVPVSLAPLQTLLDRPFVQMSLYLPLAWLGGLGLAGVSDILQGKRWATIVVMSALFGALFAHIGLTYNFAPSSCCIIFQRDDAVAVDWLDKNTTESANILIAASTLNVFDTPENALVRGTDAGIWITPLTGHKTAMQSCGLDFSLPETHASLCEQGISHIYVGEMGESFNLKKLRLHSEWYLEAFSLPETKVFIVQGCDTGTGILQ